jgi:hypothetical protein
MLNFWHTFSSSLNFFEYFPTFWHTFSNAHFCITYHTFIQLCKILFNFSPFAQVCALLYNVEHFAKILRSSAFLQFFFSIIKAFFNNFSAISTISQFLQTMPKYCDKNTCPTSLLKFKLLLSRHNNFTQIFCVLCKCVSCVRLLVGNYLCNILG